MHTGYGYLSFYSGIFFFLAHWIRTCAILPWDRKSYLTHVNLPRLSREGFTKNAVFYSVQEKESIICVRMG